MKTFMGFLFLGLITNFAWAESQQADASTLCNKSESKFVWQDSSSFGGRVFFENLRFCIHGKTLPIISNQGDPSFYRDHSSGLCKAVGLGATVSTQNRLVREAELLAIFDEKGGFAGLDTFQSNLNVGPYLVEAVDSLTCESK